VPVPEPVLLQGCLSRLGLHDSLPDPEAIKTAVKQTLAFHGYTVCSLTVTGTLPDYSVKITIPKIASVSLTGNKWITEDYIRHQLKLDSDYYNAYELDKAIRRVSSEPAVHTVLAKTSRTQDGHLDIRLTVVEQKPYRVVLATQYTDIDNYYGVGLTWNEYNPSGLQLDIRALAGLFSGSLLNSLQCGKSFWGHNLRLEGRYFNTVKSWDEPDFINTRQEVQEIGGEAEVQYQLASTARIRAGGFGKMYKTPALTNDLAVAEGTAFGDYIRLDIRGKLPLQDLPRFKWRNTFFYQGTGPGGLGDFRFHTLQANVDGEFTLWHFHRSRTTFHFGWQQGTVPPQEQFSLGGIPSLPGYNSDAFVNTRMVRASQQFYLYARHWQDETSWFSPFRVILFFNAGTVWGQGNKFMPRDLKYDAGLEINYQDVLRLGIAQSYGPFQEDWPHIYLGWNTRVLQPLQKLVQ
jgi:outer membrane protein assembly factor BamA